MSEDYLGIDHIGVAVDHIEAVIHTSQNVLSLHRAGGESLPQRSAQRVLGGIPPGPTRLASHSFTPKLTAGCCSHGCSTPRPNRRSHDR